MGINVKLIIFKQFYFFFKKKKRVDNIFRCEEKKNLLFNSKRVEKVCFDFSCSYAKYHAHADIDTVNAIANNRHRMQMNTYSMQTFLFRWPPECRH